MTVEDILSLSLSGPPDGPSAEHCRRMSTTTTTTMHLLKLILLIQLTLAATCLLIQLYALFSTKWAIFESKVELGESLSMPVSVAANPRLLSLSLSHPTCRLD